MAKTLSIFTRTPTQTVPIYGKKRETIGTERYAVWQPLFWAAPQEIEQLYSAAAILSLVEFGQYKGQLGLPKDLRADVWLMSCRLSPTELWECICELRAVPLTKGGVP